MDFSDFRDGMDPVSEFDTGHDGDVEIDDDDDDLYETIEQYVWGLHRGQISSYTSLPANSLRLQPALKKAIQHKQVALLPPVAVLKKLVDLQTRNSKAPFGKRQIFTEIIPFQSYEYRIVPLKNLSFYIRDPTTRKVSPIKTASLPSFEWHAHPAFVLAYASDGLIFPPTIAHNQLKPLGNKLDECLMLWNSTAAVPLEFYKGSWVGEFGRSVPAKWKSLLLPKAPVKVAVEKDEKEDEPTVKRRKLDVEVVVADVKDSAVAEMTESIAIDKSKGTVIDKSKGIAIDKPKGATVTDKPQGTAVDKPKGAAVTDKPKRTTVDKSKRTAVSKEKRTTVGKEDSTVVDKADRTVVDKLDAGVVESAQVKVAKGKGSKRKRT
ncbi:hypothetical protein CPB85DRAFT_1440237 [Mucidula mucida]|nr:hypothetical protein CPB85DRAFT_1440237 [Mucidula mucida]